MAETRRRRYEKLAESLKGERSSFESHWKDLANYILPRRLRLTTSETNRGDKKNQNIIDSTATFAAGTLSSGMMSGVTSPARPWFRLTVPELKLAEIGAVKEWLHLVTERMASVFLRCNLYQALPTHYSDLGTFATAALYLEEDFEEVMRAMPFAVGSYWISCNEKLKVDTFYREFRMTTRQAVEKFAIRKGDGKLDLSMFSDTVRRAWEEENYEFPFDVCHLIHPNPEWNPKLAGSKFKRYESCYWELGAGSSSSAGDQDKFLREAGYDRFPVLVSRWKTTGEDAYGTDCPGMVVVGDVKALQLMHKRKSQAIEKQVNPPMTAPTALKTQRASIVAGDITYLDTRDGQNGFKPTHEVNVQLNYLLQDISEHQRRISRGYFEDLFLMLAQSDRRQITAREIDERHEEKLLALGPVLEQLNQDLLNPLIDLAFDFMLAQGLIPEPPEELQGTPLKVEFVSIMAQAQKLVALGGMERFQERVTTMAAVDPNVLDKFNSDQYLDEYANILSTPPGVVRTDEEVAQIRSSRAQAAQQQAAAEQAKLAASSAKDLGSIDMGGDTALNRMLQQSQAGSMLPQPVGA